MTGARSDVTAACPAPARLPVALAPTVRVSARGRLLAGGSPSRLVALTEQGARVASRWRAAAPVGEGLGERRLARRLLEAGILTPHPSPADSTAELTIVVPVRDRPGQLRRCLESIRAACPASSVVVVDDGSVHSAPVRAICSERGVRLMRHEQPRGPAAARNTGLAVCATPFVGFVDSDVVLPVGCAPRLLGHLCDPAVGAVAPRVWGLPPARGAIGGYEARHSALDMGPRSGLVAPGQPVSYVPGAVLFARRAAIPSGFDETLWVGEDVDLVWRLCRAGWRVRYAAEVQVWHEHRVRMRDFTADRWRYARSLGALSRRHPGLAPAMWVSPGLALTWGLALAGRPRPAVACAGWTLLRYGRRVSRLPGSATALAGQQMTRGLAATGLGLAYAIRRAWAPAMLAVAWRRPRVWAIVAAAFAVPVVEDALAARDRDTVVSDAGLRLLAELVALAGTWEGCARGRTLGPLLPARCVPGSGRR